MPSQTLPKPDYATENMRLVGHSDQGGRCDGVQIMEFLKHGTRCSSR